MSLIQNAANTGVSTGVSLATTSLWNHCANQAFYLIRFEDNHESLGNRMNELRSLRDHVNRRVEADEANGMTRTPVVVGWLQRVEATGQDVDLLLQQGSQQIQYIGCCCLRNWWECYKLGKKVSKKLPVVEELIRKGNFDVVADKSLPSSVQVIPVRPTVGMDAIFHKVWRLLGEEKVNVVGIYGMGGVGKTTLLKRIHNAFGQIAQAFDVVIWVLVSKEFSVPNVQAKIGQRLGLTWSEDAGESEKAKRIFHVLRKKKFVLLLDDIWQPLDLEAIGVSFPNDGVHHSNSKVVFTTRSESVCRSMEADQVVKMPILDWDQAWILFQQKVGHEALDSHSEIPNLAAEVAKQCGGLPLALITIGRAMATKKTLPEWRYAIKTLKNSAAEFSGMEERVLATLKFSYDSLESDTVRNCFLYLSLYTVSFDIWKDQIVQQWIAEGFLDDLEDYNDAFDKGHDIIGILRAACLLEGGMYNEEDELTMHDIVADMALWIACESGKKKNIYLVQANVGLTEAPNVQSWKDAQRISLMDNDIKELREAPECPYLQTLLLLRNSELSRIACGFFQYMPNLRVLELTCTHITEVPKSIGYLVELRYLNLSITSIRTLPDEVGNLTKLRYLGLNGLYSLTNIPQGMILKFSKLQMLDFQDSGHKGGDDIGYPSVAELECLEHLGYLGATVRDFLTLASMSLSPRLRLCLRKLSISRYHGLIQMNLVPSWLFGEFKRLEHISIEFCLRLKEVRISSVKEDELLPSLKVLCFAGLPKMNIIWNGGLLCFNNLLHVYICQCHALKDISWLVLAPVLTHLNIHLCWEVEDILVKNHNIALSKLRFLVLIGLPKLASISRISLALPCLQEVRVIGCPLLKKLPFTSNSTKKPFLEISGDTKWWNELVWEEETVKSSFQAYFKQMK